MSLLCCCRNRQQPAEKETQTPAIQLPIQPPRARLSKTLSRSDTNMYLSSLLASRGPSQVVIPAYHNIVDPEAVDAEDSDEDGPERDMQRSNTGTLGSFRTRLIRRLSHRVDTKAGSRPSAGTSEEELARRAELKRLMHKRIQEELKSEEEEENDDGDLKLLQHKPHSIDNCKEPELPGGGPRDTIEFTVSIVGEQETEKEVDKLPETSHPATPVRVRPQEPYQQPTSSGSAPRSTDDSYHECNVSFNEAGSILQPPSPPHLTPVHLLGGNGRESPSTASWRLSYSAIHIESYIEPLVAARQISSLPSPEPGNAFSRREDDTAHTQEADNTANYSNLTMHDETIDTSQTMQFNQGVVLDMNSKESGISSDLAEANGGRYSPLDVWLRSQDLHCASVLSSRPNSEMALENYEYGPQEQTESLQKTETLSDLSTHHDQIVNRSLILQHAPGVGPEPAKHIDGEQKDLITAPSDESIALYEVLNRIENAFPTEDPPTEDQTPEMSSRYASSRYTTRPNSQQATPKGSHLNLAEILVSHRIQRLSPIYGSVSPYRTTTSDNSDLSSYQTAMNKTPSNHAKSNPELSQFPTSEAPSANASETASFRQREEELKSIKKRFGLTPARRYPTATARSKFREEFECSKGSSSGRSSILSKLYFALPKRTRASRSHTELNQRNEQTGIYSIDFRKNNKTNLADIDSDRDHDLPSSMSSNIRLKEKATEQPDIKQEVGHHLGRLKEKPIKATMPIANMDNDEARSALVNDCDPNITNIFSASGAGEMPPPRHQNNMAMLDEGKTGKAVGIHVGVLQEWVGQLQAEDVQRHSRMEPRINVAKRQPLRFRAPPESWARWPSHTREERTSSAGVADKVNSRDFAVAVTPSSYEVETGRNGLSAGREQITTSRTLSSQVSKALKSGWNKMVTHTDSADRMLDHGCVTQRHRESQDFLEYPELELLPTVGGYKEIQALDRQIDIMKRWSTSGRKVLQQPSRDSARPPLASRISEEVHRFKTEDKHAAWIKTAKGPEATQFLSPTHSTFTRRPNSCNPDLSAASESQCMYEDCVQTHMLHDDDDSNRNTIQDRTTIKRAKSTGNIEAKLSSDNPPVDQNTPSNHGPVHKAWKSGLRRHKSLGWIRGRGCGGDKDTPITVG